MEEAEKYVGYPYVWGGSGPSSGFDCSGFICWVINHCGNGWHIERTNADHLYRMLPEVSREEAKPGDLVFFEGTYETEGASHVGIYLGENRMLHSGMPLQYSGLDEPYWSEHLCGFRKLATLPESSDVLSGGLSGVTDLTGQADPAGQPDPAGQEDPAGQTEDGPDYLILVNKDNILPPGWEDAVQLVTCTNSLGDTVNIEERTYEAYLRLKNDLQTNDGIFLELDSAHRDALEQQKLVDEFADKYGAEEAARIVAKPGYSEHHTGLACDLYFRLRQENEWKDICLNEDLLQHAEIWEAVHHKLGRYGFILRYLKDKEAVTGYAYEPWHIRYLDNADLATKIMEENITLEEYLGTEQ